MFGIKNQNTKYFSNPFLIRLISVYQLSNLNSKLSRLGLLIGVQKAQISKLKKGNNSASISTVIKVFSALKAKIKFKIELADSPELIAQ